MKKIVLALVFLLSVTSSAFGQYEEKDFQLKPEAGVWFGTMTPFPGTSFVNILNPTLGFGAFFRLNVPSDNFLTEIGASYYKLDSFLTESLTQVPVYLSLVYKLPVDFALSFFFKGGAGAGYFKSEPEGHDGILPIFFAGFETSFPAGKIADIGVRFDYYFIYESWMTPPTSNFKMIDGHFITISIMAEFNLNP